MLEVRSYEKELMDDLESTGTVIVQTLKELDTINRLLGGNQVSIQGLQKLMQGRANTPTTLVDLGCGGGDILILMAKWARKKGYNIQFIGVDANQSIVEYAQENCKAYPEISFSTVNIFADQFRAQTFDIIHASLFTHHFTDEELLAMFQQYKHQAKLGIIVNDLHRHWFAYHAIKILTRLLSNSEMVRNDAAVSVARGFKKIELEKLLQQAGIKDYQLAWRWAFRWKLVVG